MIFAACLVTLIIAISLVGAFRVRCYYCHRAGWFGFTALNSLTGMQYRCVNSAACYTRTIDDVSRETEK